MSNSFKKIPAFTLSDVLVSLAISGILFGIIYTAIALVTNNIGNIKDNFVQGDGLRLTQQQITLDFSAFPTIKYNDFEQKLVFSSPLDSVVYQFEDDYIVRQRDTLAIVIQEKTVFFNGNTIQKGNVDALKLLCKKEKEIIPLFIFKKNDAHSIVTNGN